MFLGFPVRDGRLQTVSLRLSQDSAAATDVLVFIQSAFRVVAYYFSRFVACNNTRMNLVQSKLVVVCVYYCSPYYKAVRVGEGGWWRTCATRDDEPSPVCGLVCPSRTSERGGEGDCVKEGGGEEGERERERALGLLLCHSPQY